MTTRRSLPGWIAILVCTLAIFTSAPHRALAEDRAAPGAEAALIQELDDAETYYWLSLFERGSMSVLRRGLEHAARAEELLKSLPEERRAAYAGELDGLKSDLLSQQRLAHDTLYGLFPLVRFFSQNQFSPKQNLSAFELIDDPETIAVREAVEKLIAHVVHEQKTIPQLDVILTSSPRNAELENEALYLFAGSPRFFVHNMRELARDFSEDEREALRRPPLSPELHAKVMRAMQTTRLLQVHLRKVNETHGDHLYVAQSRLYSENSPRPELVLKNYGICIDRRGLGPLFAALYGLVFLLAMAAYSLCHRHSLQGGAWPGIQSTVLVAGLGVLSGRILASFVVSMFVVLSPAPERLVYWSFWWPVATGLTALLGPIAAVWIATRRFNLKMPVAIHSVCLPVMLGSAAYFSGLALLYKKSGGAVYALAFLAGVTLSGILLSRLLRSDKSTPAPLAAIAVASLATLATGITAMSLPLLGAGIGIAAAGLALTKVAPCFEKTGTGAKDTAHAAPAAPAATAPACNDLHVETENTKLLTQRLQAFAAAPDRFLLCVEGPTGVGKTHAVAAALEELRAAQSNTLEIYHGACPPSPSGETPYAVFASVLRDHLPKDFFNEYEGLGLVEKAFSDVIGSLMPISKILFHSTGADASGGKNEIFTAVLNLFRMRTKKKGVLLVLDNIEYIDAASAELLHFLLKALGGDNSPQLKCVLLLDDATPFATAYPSQTERLRFRPLTDAETTALCERRFSLDHDCAEQIVRYLGEDSSNLAYLVHAIQFLMQNGTLADRNGRLAWSEAFVSLHASLPPGELRIRQHAIFEDETLNSILHCASCIGFEFSVFILRDALGLSGIALLHALNKIENQTSWLHEVPGTERFRFKSIFIFEELRSHFGIDAHGPKGRDMTQLGREYYAAIAKAHEQLVEQGRGDVYQLATQYYLAGAGNEAKAITYCLEAALRASSLFQHQLALSFVDKAQEYSDAATPKTDIDWVRTKVLCNEAHYEGILHQQAVSAARNYIARVAPQTFEPYEIFLRALYDAGMQSHIQDFLSECRDVAKRCLETFSAPYEKALAGLFLALSQPRDMRTERLALLQQAREELAESWQSSPRNGQVYAMILNALAEELRQGSAADREQAIRYFELSIAIKERKDINDTVGLAMSHGGLGRLFFYADDPDYARAAKHFALDLKYSEQIGSLTGIVKMHSALGSCALHTQAWTEAESHFAKSLDKATGPVDIAYALMGLLETSIRSRKTEKTSRYGAQLSRHIQEVAHAPAQDGAGSLLHLKEELGPLLELCKEQADSQWHTAIRQFVAAK